MKQVARTAKMMNILENLQRWSRKWQTAFVWPIAEVTNRTGVRWSCVRPQKHSQKQRRRIKYAAIPLGTMRKPLDIGLDNDK
jgi:hypothetical protein